MSSNLTFKDRAINFFERKRVKIITDFFNLRIIENHKFVWEAKGINVLAGITLGTLVLIIYIMIDIYKVNFGETLSSDNAVWGTFGDFFGGTLNPILAFVSFLAVIYTVGIQNKQFKTNEKTQAIQQFEGFFAYMASELRDIYKGLDDESKDVNTYLILGIDKFSLKNKLRTDFELVRFLIYLYQVLKRIDELDKKFFDFNDKKRYSNLIRAGLSNEVLQIIYLNCVDFGNAEIDDFSEYKSLITEYSFLEHMTFKIDNNQNYDYSLIYYSQFFDKRVFGESYYFKEINAGFYTEKIKSRKDYINKQKLIIELFPTNGLFLLKPIPDKNYHPFFLSFENINDIAKYSYHSDNYKNGLNLNKDFILKNENRLEVFNRFNDFLIDEITINSISIKSIYNPESKPQLFLKFYHSSNNSYIQAKYFVSLYDNSESIYSNGTLERIE